MTPQERQMIDDLFDRLARLESAPRDPDAVAAMAQGLRQAPNAVYALVQTVLVQDEALKRANSRIQELEAGGAPAQQPSGGFLNSMRGAIFGQNQPHGSVPNVPPPVQPPGLEQRPGDAAGPIARTLRPAALWTVRLWTTRLRSALRRAPAAHGGRRLVPGHRGGRGRRHGRRIAAARQHPLDDGRQPQGFGDAGGARLRAGGQTPWSDQSGSTLARDAGINDIGSSAGRGDDNSRAGLFDTASNDDQT